MTKITCYKKVRASGTALGVYLTEELGEIGVGRGEWVKVTVEPADPDPADPDARRGNFNTVRHGRSPTLTGGRDRAHPHFSRGPRMTDPFDDIEIDGDLVRCYKAIYDGLRMDGCYPDWTPFSVDLTETEA